VTDTPVHDVQTSPSIRRPERAGQPVYVGLAAVEHPGWVILPGDARRGTEGGRPEVFNTDRGVQFAAAFVGGLEGRKEIDEEIGESLAFVGR
jgi:hypothetical protein